MTFGFVLMSPAASLAASGARADPIVVNVKPMNEGFEISVTLVVPARQREVWDVLTDFDGMAGVVSNLQTSRILSRLGNRVVVEQRGSEAEGPFRIEFQSVREVELNPISEMHSKLISGSMRRMDGWTRLSTINAGTLVESQGRLDAGAWAYLPAASHFIAGATRRQYAEMRTEILQRAGARGSERS